MSNRRRVRGNNRPKQALPRSLFVTIGGEDDDCEICRAMRSGRTDDVLEAFFAALDAAPVCAGCGQVRRFVSWDEIDRSDFENVELCEACWQPLP